MIPSRARTQRMLLFLGLLFCTACGEEVLDEGDLQNRGLIPRRAPASVKAPPSSPPLAERLPRDGSEDLPILEVGKGKVPWSTFAQYYANRLRSLRQAGKVVLPTRKDALARSILDELLTLELTWQEAQRRGLAASDSDVDAYLKSQILPRMGGDLHRLAARLEKRGHSLRSFKDNVRRNISSLKLMESVASAAASRLTTTEMERYWTEHETRYRLPARLRFAHLVVNRPRSGDPVAVEETRKQVRELRQRLASGASFARLAREASTCPCKRRGGVVPPIEGNGTRQDTHPPLPRIVSSKLAELAVGEISPVLETPGGFEILHLRGKEEARALPFAHVAHRVRADLARLRTEELLESYVNRLRKAISIHECFPPSELVAAFEEGRVPRGNSASAGEGTTEP